MIELFLIVAVSFVLIGLVFLVSTLKKKQELGVITGTRIYEDSETRPGQLLFANSLPVVGKPDSLVQKGIEIIPVELKTGNTPSAPYDSHIMQLMCYCLLVQENYNIRPKYGIIRYPEAQFEIEFSEENEAHLREIVLEMVDIKTQNKEPAFDKNSLCKDCEMSI